MVRVHALTGSDQPVLNEYTCRLKVLRASCTICRDINMMSNDTAESSRIYIIAEPWLHFVRDDSSSLFLQK